MVILLVIFFAACFTVLAIAGGVIYVKLIERPSRAVRIAEDSVRIAEAHTKREIEDWKQNWILDQRQKGERPELPPGTQTTLPR